MKPSPTDIPSEILPISARLELENGKWVPRYFPPNLGGPRDIPDNATIHPSVGLMIKDGILDGSMNPVLGGSSFWQDLRRLFGMRSNAGKQTVEGRVEERNGGP